MPSEGTEFEEEVLRIARLLWPSAHNVGSVMIDGRERDGVIVTEECVHLIEATISRRKDKAINDTSKLMKLAGEIRKKYEFHAVKCYLITKDEPTADQRTSVTKMAKNLVAILSIEEFRTKLVDVFTYLDTRSNHVFGSSIDPDTERPSDPKQYIPHSVLSKSGDQMTPLDIGLQLCRGKNFALLGDYGSGKSTTSREVYFSIERQFKEKKSNRFPIHINLREHHGQIDAAEALERHARTLGYHTPSHLVRSWKAGCAIIILDGFDEIALSGWTGDAKKLRTIRYDSMQLVRSFGRQNPRDSGLLICGRSHYFDTINELKIAFHISNLEILNIDDFGEEQITQFFNKRGLSQTIPEWLPSRPLLLGYLVSKKFIEELQDIDAELSPSKGWDELLRRVCNREADIEAGIDGSSLRKIIERLASMARRTHGGIGPVYPSDLVDAFVSVCGHNPDNRAMVLLQRLPALGSPRGDDGSRVFIDKDFADAARSGEVEAYILAPHGATIFSPNEWYCFLDDLGVAIAAEHIRGLNVKARQSSVALERASKEKLSVLSYDITRIHQECNFEPPDSTIYISDIDIEHFDPGGSSIYSKIQFQSCIFGLLEAPRSIPDEDFPLFSDCIFSTIVGRASAKDLPKNRFDAKCSFDVFNPTGTTTDSIMELDLPLGVRILLTVSRKLFLQVGSGRRESSLFRGLDQKGKSLVSNVIQLIRSEGLIIKSRMGGETVWLPVRSSGARIRKILSNPGASTDVLVRKSSEL